MQRRSSCISYTSLPVVSSTIVYSELRDKTWLVESYIFAQANSQSYQQYWVIDNKVDYLSVHYTCTSRHAKVKKVTVLAWTIEENTVIPKKLPRSNMQSPRDNILEQVCGDDKRKQNPVMLRHWPTNVQIYIIHDTLDQLVYTDVYWLRSTAKIIHQSVSVCNDSCKSTEKQ